MINTDCQTAMETVSAPYCFTIRLAEKNIRIESQYRRVYDQCKHYQVQNVQPDLWVFPTTVMLTVSSSTGRISMVVFLVAIC